VRPNGRLLDDERGGDLAVPEPAGDQLEDLSFRRGERVETGRPARSGRLLGDAVDHAAGDRGREQGVAGGDRVDARDQLLGSGSLDQEARGPSAQRAEDVVLLEVVRISTRTWGAARASSRVAAIPSTSGMRTSISTTSGASSRARSTAPDRLMPHRRSRSPGRRRGAANPAQMRSSSWAISTRVTSRELRREGGRRRETCRGSGPRPSCRRAGRRARASGSTRARRSTSLGSRRARGC
jgi:hypothetical protein